MRIKKQKNEKAILLFSILLHENIAVLISYTMDICSSIHFNLILDGLMLRDGSAAGSVCSVQSTVKHYRVSEEGEIKGRVFFFSK